jgi:diphthamide synthase (EF-2-diphthine--ammonia ligase)
LFEVVLEPACSNDAYEGAFRDAAARVRAAFPGLRHLAFGDLFLADVRAYRERLVSSVDMEAVFPLWGSDTALLARQFVAEGYRASLVCVDTQQLDASFAGASFDDALLAALPAGVDPCGENGEFHTFVSDGPIFREPVPVVAGELVMREQRFAYRDLLPVPTPTTTEWGKGRNPLETARRASP